MSAFVLVPGGGHGGWCYQRLAALLRRAGHVVHAVTPTGFGERSHLLSADVDLVTHVADVVNLLFYEDLTDVVLVGHSYGGMVVTGAADRALDRVGKLVYLDSLNPKNGETTVDAHPPMLREAILPELRAAGEVVDGIELVLVPQEDGSIFPGEDPSTLFGVTDAEDVAWMRERLSPQPWACFEQPLVLANEAELAAIPQFHIVTAGTVPFRDQELIARARAEGRFWEIDGAHDLMITEPRTVAALLEEIAST